MMNGLLPLKDPEPKRLTYEQIRRWNTFMAGKPKGTRESLYKDYRKQSGDQSFSFAALDNELRLLESALRSRAVKNNTLSGEDTTAGNLFPEMMYNGTNLGPVNGDERTEVQPPAKPGYPEKLLAKTIPADVADIFWDNDRQLPYFLDPKTGDLQYTYQHMLHHPRFNRSIMASLIPSHSSKKL